MLRTIFVIGLFAILGLFALKVVFGILPWLFAILFMLLGMALKVAIVGGIIYVLIRIFAPDTAKRMRERWSGR